VFAHFDADGASAPALEAELDGAPSEQRMARRPGISRGRLVEQRQLS